MRSLLLIAVLATSATLLHGSDLLRTGAEFQVNTWTTNSQGDPSVARARTGEFMVVWESFGQDGSGFGVFGQRFSASGARRGGEFQINDWTTGNQFSPSVEADGAGNFVVVWESAGQDGSGFGIFARRFTSAGTPIGPEFQVNTWTSGNQVSASVAAAPAGDFVITWSSAGQDGSGYGVFARRYDAAGAAQGGEFQVNTWTTSDQFSYSEAISSDAAGNFVVVWESFGQDGSNLGVFGKRYDAAGAPRGGAFQVNTWTTSGQHNASVASGPAGDFVVVWDSFHQDGSSWGVFGQVYDSAGARVGGEFRVNVETYSGQIMGSLAKEPSGGFIVVWYSALQDGSDLGIFARRFTAEGMPRGTEFQVNTYTLGEQNLPSVSVDASGHATIVWYSFLQDGSDVGVFGQRFACDPEAGRVTDLIIEPADGGATLSFTWSAVQNADDYVVLEDHSPGGPFVANAGTSAAPGLVIPAPPEDMMYYLVAARNSSCGLGPYR